MSSYTEQIKTPRPWIIRDYAVLYYLHQSGHCYQRFHKDSDWYLVYAPIPPGGTYRRYTLAGGINIEAHGTVLQVGQE